MTKPEGKSHGARVWVARAFSLAEDVVYVGLGLLLAASAVVLLVSGIIDFGNGLAAGNFTKDSVGLLDRILLILLVVELLYTVQVSFREHALLPEPFLLVGLIAAIRRVLLLTAEFGQAHAQTEVSFRHFLIELAILTGLIVAVAVSLVLVRKGQSQKS